MLSNYVYNQSLAKAINAYKSHESRGHPGSSGGTKGKNSSPVTQPQ